MKSKDNEPKVRLIDLKAIRLQSFYTKPDCIVLSDNLFHSDPTLNVHVRVPVNNVLLYTSVGEKHFEETKQNELYTKKPACHFLEPDSQLVSQS